MGLLEHVRSFDLPAYGDGEVRFLEQVVIRFRPTHVFDWGTNVGASARLFYEAGKLFRYPCDVHTFELPFDLAYLDRDHPGEERYAQQLQGIPVNLHWGFGLEASLQLCAELKPERPLFFLDGCHDHDVVLHELSTIADQEPVAVMVVHDTNELTGTAVDEFQFHYQYRREDEFTDAGLVALWPRP